MTALQAQLVDYAMVYPRIMSTDLDDLTCKMDRQEDLGEETSLMPRLRGTCGLICAI
jgi:hypothetical protein